MEDGGIRAEALFVPGGSAEEQFAAAVENGGTLAALMVIACEDLEICRYLVPNPRARSEVLGTYFAAFMVDGVCNGGIMLARIEGEGVCGAALWRESWRGAPAVVGGYPAWLRATCGENAGRFEELDRLRQRNRPTGEYDHLTLFGMLPEGRSLGMGTVLLSCQRASGRRAYAEAWSPRLRALYERCGFVVHREFQVPRGPRCWGMLR